MYYYARKNKYKLILNHIDILIIILININFKKKYKITIINYILNLRRLCVNIQ